jgi:hypothetical protein
MKSKVFAMSICLALFLARGVQAQERYYLSQVANGNFGDGSFRTAFILFNNTDADASVSLKLTDDNGGPLTVTIGELGRGSEFNIALSAGASRILQTDGLGSLAVGGATVTSTASIGASAVFTIYDVRGKYVTEAGVGNSQLLTEFIFPVDVTGSFNTGLALLNTGSGNALITTILRGTDGQEAGRTTMTLPGNNHMARFVAGQGQLFPAVSNFRGTLLVRSSIPIAAVVLRQNQTPISYTSLPVVSTSSTTRNLNLAQVANGSYSGGSFKTSFLLFNLTATAADVNLSLTKDDGSPFPVTIPGLDTNSAFRIPLAAGASAFLQTDGSGPVTAGAAMITANVPIGASGIFAIFNPQGVFQTEAGVGDSPMLTSLTLPVDITDSFDTGVAFFNPGSSPITLTLKLLDWTGAEARTSATISLGGKQHSASFVSQIFTGTDVFRGSVAISATAGVASLTLRQNSSILSYTTLDVVSGAASGKPAQASSQAKIQAALAAGTIDYGTSLLYRGYALFGDARLPDSLLGSGSNEEDNGLRSEIVAGRGNLSADLQSALELFTVRPTDPKSWFKSSAAAAAPMARAASRSARSPQLFSSDAGNGWWYWKSESSQFKIWVQNNGDMDYQAESLAIGEDAYAILAKIWEPMVHMMGEPIYDQEGGDGAIDIYIVDYRASVHRRDRDFIPDGLGSTFTDYPLNGKTSSGFILIPRSLYGNVRFHATLIHEFFHVLQRRHNEDILGQLRAGAPKTYDAYWFGEASARWAAVHFDRTLAPWADGRAAFKDAHQNFTERFQQSGLSLNASVMPHMYDAYIWAYFLELESLPNDFQEIGTLWRLLEGAKNFAEADDILNAKYPFKVYFRQFAVRNLNTAFLPGDPLPRSKRYIGLDEEFKNDKIEPRIQPGQDFTGNAHYVSTNFSGPLEPLSARYEKFRVTDPAVKRVVFDLSGLAESGGLDVDALIKVKGRNWEPRDLNGKAELKFCFDNPGEALEEIRLILSNHNYKKGESELASFTADSFTTSCANFSGSAKATHNILGGGATLKETQTATVTLKFDAANSDAYHDHYIAEGLVTWTVSGSDGACSYAGSLTAPLGPLDGSLDIYHLGGMQLSYFGGGRFPVVAAGNAQATANCGSGGSQTIPWLMTGGWFLTPDGITSPLRTVEPDGKTVKGTFISLSGLDTYEWQFVLPTNTNELIGNRHFDPDLFPISPLRPLIETLIDGRETK